MRTDRTPTPMHADAYARRADRAAAAAVVAADQRAAELRRQRADDADAQAQRTGRSVPWHNTQPPPPSAVAIERDAAAAEAYAKWAAYNGIGHWATAPEARRPQARRTPPWRRVLRALLRRMR